ncbi:protein FAM216A-like isoform X2 [Toxotes jaculatrix]|uniref:protein FAM216A-like isoform X2 n=1 Tax=Toxotes jaculatrix TaxID=941984 RepID=UPI001B3B1993|nr:protein FAM216A-like isoform X2 [Toxotes jaculatrix]
MYRGTHINVSAGGQHMKTIHIPKSMMSAPFLQHPALTAGQRRYLCSIANVYSTEHMRRQMKQHYLNVLHTCVHSGQNPTCRRRYGDHQHESSMLTKDADKDEEARAKPLGQRKGSSTANSDVIFPKIVNK